MSTARLYFRVAAISFVTGSMFEMLVIKSGHDFAQPKDSKPSQFQLAMRDWFDNIDKPKEIKDSATQPTSK